MEENVTVRHPGDGSDSGPTERARRPRTLPRSFNLFRPNSLSSLIPNRRSKVMHTYSSTDSCNSPNGDLSPATPVTPVPNNEKALQISHALPLIRENSKKGWDTMVTLVIVEAKGLPDPPSDGSSHGLYCKIRLGSETRKSKTVNSSTHPEWRERFKLHLNKDHSLRVSLWDKGRQKNFMGSCDIDLSTLEKEKTHELWQLLEGGFGSIHFNLTMCTVRNVSPMDSPDNNNVGEMKEAFDFNFNDWQSVGQLHVKVIGARGLNGKPNAYCQLEVENERVQTPSAKGTSEPMWNRSYVFNVRDVSSTLDLKVYDNSLVSSFRSEHLGKVSIPLLRVNNGETRWYALKGKNKRNSAKGNCPRVLLQMSLIYNPIKASIKLFRPAEVKHITKKHFKYDLDLAIVYSNLIFVEKTFVQLIALNDGIKSAFEWESRELSSLALAGWLTFWYYIQLWHIPLLIMVPFIFFYFQTQNEYQKTYLRVYKDNCEITQIEKDDKNESSLATKIAGLPELNLFILKCIEYMESISQRITNLVSFKVPFLSYLTMILLAIASILLYFVPINYLMMGCGIYKYMRKYLNPDRKLNNDLLDFISRVPDNEILKDWEELSVPEPHHHKSPTGVLVRSTSNAL